MTKNETSLSELKINKLTQKQYNEALQYGDAINENELYFISDANIGNSEIFNDYVNNRAGIRGYYFSRFEANKINTNPDQWEVTIDVTSSQGSNFTKTSNNTSIKLVCNNNDIAYPNYDRGDILSIFCDGGFVNCIEITDIINETITGKWVSTAKITSVNIPYSTHEDEFSVYCIDKPDNGEVSLSWYAHAEGYNNKAFNRAAHAEGRNSQAYGHASHTEGNSSASFGHASHAEGYYSEAHGQISHAEGKSTTAQGDVSHAEGWGTLASGSTSHAEGYITQATGSVAHAEGYDTKATGKQAHAEGRGTLAAGAYSHAEGYSSSNTAYFAQGDYSHVEGQNTYAEGAAAHAGGAYTKAIGDRSFAHGFDVVAEGVNSFAIGQYGETNANAIFSVGTGTTSQSRNNAFEVNKDGNVYAKQKIYVGGAGANQGSAKEVATISDVTDLRNRLNTSISQSLTAAKIYTDNAIAQAQSSVVQIRTWEEDD